MNFDFSFFFNSIILGVGLAMDAFSVALVNGLHEPKMKKHKEITIARMFALFQAVMPIIGWFCVHTIADKFEVVKPFIPWVSLCLLVYIGIGMMREGMSKESEVKESAYALTLGTLICQGVATSIDALSVGFTIAHYNQTAAIVCAVIISVVTFFISLAGVIIGKHFGTKFLGKSSILGGALLIFIGVEIFLKGII